MYCTNCGKEMNEQQAICLNCGVKPGVGRAFCGHCGRSVAPNAEVCMGCGVPLKKAAGNLAGKDKTTMALICFFLGGLGVHNFMMGESKKGIFKIVMSLCCGIGGIFALIDFINILCDKYVVDPEKLI